VRRFLSPDEGSSNPCKERSGMAEMQLAREMGMSLDAPAEPAATWPSQGCLLKALRNGFTLLLSNGLGFAQRNCRKQRWARREGGKSGIRAKDRAVRKRRARRADAWWPFWGRTGRRVHGSISTSLQAARRKPVLPEAPRTRTRRNTTWNGSVPGCRWKCARRTSTAMRSTESGVRRAMQRNKLKRAYGLYRTGMRQA